MSITVAEEGNRRTGGMTGAEVEQCAFDIKSWFLRTAGESIRSIGGASTVDIQRLEKSIDTRIPNEIKTLLTEINGGIYFFDKKLMSTEEFEKFIPPLMVAKNGQIRCFRFVAMNRQCSLFISAKTMPFKNGILMMA